MMKVEVPERMMKMKTMMVTRKLLQRRQMSLLGEASQSDHLDQLVEPKGPFITQAR